MQQSLFQGSATAIITPFKNGAVDFPALEKLVETQIENGIKALIVCGTTGEPTTLTDSEKKATIESVVKTANNRITIICGTGSNATKHVIEAEKQYRDLGCAAQLVVTPYYNKTSQDGLYAHYMHIAENTTLPIMLYNVPSRTQLEIMPETLYKLSKCEKFVALKESSYQFPLILERRQAMGNMALYSGNDDMIYPLLALGAQGVVSVMSNVIPENVVGITDAYFAGNTKLSLQRQLDCIPFIKALFAETSPIPCKYIASKLGLCENELRLPLVCANEKIQKQLNDTYKVLKELKA